MKGLPKYSESIKVSSNISKNEAETWKYIDSPSATGGLRDFFTRDS